MSRRIWTYILLPVLLLNTIPVCLFGAVFALAYVQNGAAENVDTSQALLWLYVAIFIVNWGLAIFVFRKTENAVYNLIAADGLPFRFHLSLLSRGNTVSRQCWEPELRQNAFATVRPSQWMAAQGR